MGGEMGELSGEMRGTVIRGAHVEMVLADIPEQVWTWDEDVVAGSGDMAVSFGQIDASVPMAKRREIIALVLGASTRLPL